jgi:hypothetical protein
MFPVNVYKSHTLCACGCVIVHAFVELAQYAVDELGLSRVLSVGYTIQQRSGRREENQQQQQQDFQPARGKYRHSL